MHRLLDIPTQIETDRLVLRAYKPGDGQWYWPMSQKNRTHLARYEAGNVVMSVGTPAEAEAVVRELAAEWLAGRSFFMGVFDKRSNAFVAQVCIGPVNWELPDFEVGYFADTEYEGQGYVTEAVKAALRFAFEYLHAHRVSVQCDDTNVRAIRVAQFCGMIREGHIRENTRAADGSTSGTLHFGLLRREFVGHE
jgi:RimJ/RimL family protein N-acetyltransferase